MKTYYEILGISFDAGQKEIKQAYIKLARKYHPDHNNNKDDRRMVELNNIYDTLSNPVMKQEYDKHCLDVKSSQSPLIVENGPIDISTPIVEKEKPAIKYKTQRLTRDKDYYLGITRKALTVLLIVFMFYIMFYLIVKILTLGINMPAWLLKLIPN
jgi:curved DNA-binding protein CbpA